MKSKKSIVYSQPSDLLVNKELCGLQKERNGASKDISDMLCFVKLEKIDETILKRKFKCTLCDSSFLYKKSFIKHMNRTHGSKSNSVVVLNDKENIPVLNKNRRNYKQYKSNAKFQMPSLRIKRCLKASDQLISTFTTTSTLPSQENEIIFTCNACKVKIYGQIKYEEHYAQYHGNGIGIIRCSHCPVKMNNKEDLFWHLQTFHFKLKTYKCPNCDIITCSKKVLMEHMKDFHNVFRCWACECIFNLEDDLINHFENNHFKIVEPNC